MVADGKQLSTVQSPFLLDGPVAERELFSGKMPKRISHRIHVWYIYLLIWLIFMVNVDKYTIHAWILWVCQENG